MSRTPWGAVVVGAVAGLGLTAASAIVLFVAGLRTDTTGGAAAFVFAQFLGQLCAGYVGGRFGRPLEPHIGAQAALALFAVATALSVAAGGAPGIATLLLGGAVALVIGAAGGVLAAAGRR